MRIEQKIQMPKLHNRYDVKVIDTLTGEVVQEAHGENLVLDQVYHAIAANGGYFGGLDRIHYGDGTGTLSVSRTGLFSQKGAKDMGNRQVVMTPDLATVSGKITFTETEYVGGYIREVGISYPTSVYGDRILTSHALLEDSEGNPVSIGPKTNTQIIELYATIYVQRGAGMVPFPNRFTAILTSNYNTGGGGIYAPVIKPQGISLGGGTYDSATKTWTSNKVRIATGAGNDQGVLSFIENSTLEGFVSLQNEDIFPTYTFTERQVGAGDGVKKAFAFAPGLIKPNSDVIKVDGVTKVRDVDYKLCQGGPFVKKHDPTWRLPYGTVEPLVYNSNAAKEIGTLLGIQTGDDIPGGPVAFAIIDYQELVPISKLVISRPRNHYHGGTLSLYFSKDGLVWEGPEFVTFPNDFSGDTQVYTKDASDVYRYVHMDFSSNTWAVFSQVTLYGGPNIVFTTPPAENAIITAKWDVDLPPKNDKLFYDAQVAYTASW